MFETPCTLKKRHYQEIKQFTVKLQTMFMLKYLMIIINISSSSKDARITKIMNVTLVK